jgi:glycerate dehydrogenase
VNDTIFTHFEERFFELKGKTWGIIGLGNIGRRVASIAEAFGANVVYTSPSGSAPQDGYHQVDMDTLLSSSDIVSVHAPLNEHTENLMDASAFAKMKPSAIFLNLGRGAIVVEEDLLNALNQNQVRAAGLDVLVQEPMSPDNPLRQFKDSRRLFITPHIGWASIEARTNLMNIIFNQVKEFFNL